MIADVRAVMWKEWRALVSGRTRRQLLLTVGMLSIWGIWFPIQTGGEEFVSDPVLLGILTVTMPVIVVGIIVPDAIAGERERHTLATLLASRLPDRAILYGKLGFGLLMGWILAPMIMLVGLVVSNLVALDQAPLFYDPIVLLATLVLSMAVGLLAGAIGIFASLRAASVQEAQQVTVLGLMIPFMVVGFGAMIIAINDALAEQLQDLLAGLEPGVIFGVVLVALVVIDTLLLALADRRFRRARLVERIG